MKDEIKEILSLLNSSSWSNEAKQIEDYITNLQQDTEMYAQLKDEYEEEIKDLQQENERLKEYYELMVQFNEKNLDRFCDYKSRCEKASECIKKDTRWFDSEYASIYGELCDCAGAKGDRLEVMVNPSNALNILQNGSDSQ